MSRDHPIKDLLQQTRFNIRKLESVKNYVLFEFSRCLTETNLHKVFKSLKDHIAELIIAANPFSLMVGLSKQVIRCLSIITRDHPIEDL